MSQSTLSELENDSYPTSTFTTRLAHIYNVSARWLADGEGPMRVADTVVAEESATETGSARPRWPFSPRITPEAYDALDASTKEDIEDYIELKISKSADASRKVASRKRTPRKSAARQARAAA